MKTRFTSFGLFMLASTTSLLAQDYDSLIQQALRQRNDGNFSAAEQTLRSAQPLASDRSEVDLLLGMMLSFQQKFPEALAVIEQALARTPDNIELKLARARVLSYQGYYQDAATTAREVLTRQPKNIDALLLSGRIAYYQKRTVPAQLYFNQVLEQEPANLDALLGMYDTFVQSGKPDLAQPYLARAAQSAPDHIDVLARQKPEQYSIAPEHRISTGYSRSSLDILGAATWHDRFIEYRHLSANKNQQYLRLEHNKRFNRRDSMIEAGVLVNADSPHPVTLAFGYTPNDDFMPAYFARAETSTPLTDGSGDYGTLILNALYQYSSWRNGNTERMQAGLDWYLPNTDLWLSPAIGLVRDQYGDHTFAWSLGLHWQASGMTRVGASYSDAAETENLLTRNSTAVSLYWRQQLTASWVLYLTYTRLKLEGLYTRKEAAANLQYTF